MPEGREVRRDEARPEFQPSRLAAQYWRDDGQGRGERSQGRKWEQCLDLTCTRCRRRALMWW